MKVLFINSIFPNQAEPNKGNFIVKNLAAYPEEVEVKVIAPLPFFLERWRRNDNAKSIYSHQGLEPGSPLSDGDSCFSSNEEAGSVHVKASNRIAERETIRTGDRTAEVFRPRFILLPRNLLRAIVPFMEYLFIRNLAKSIYARWKFELIHANFASPDGIAAALLATELKLPLVITEHQADLAGFFRIEYLKKEMLYAYYSAAKLICVSEHTASLIRQAAPRLKNLYVIPNGVDFARFTLRPKAAKPTKLIYIGYLIPHKGVQVLLEALSLLKKEGFGLQLSVVGSGSYLPELKHIRNKLDLVDEVQFLGEKSATRVAELLCEHDAMVHPSFMESFGIVLVEALAAGLPVVSTFNGGAEGIIDPSVGILVQPRDPLALAKGIKELLARWESYKPEELRAYAEQRFSIASVANQTIELYRSVLCQ